jgi:hypothetical protein
MSIRGWYGRGLASVAAALAVVACGVAADNAGRTSARDVEGTGGAGGISWKASPAPVEPPPDRHEETIAQRADGGILAGACPH